MQVNLPAVLPRCAFRQDVNPGRPPRNKRSLEILPLSVAAARRLGPPKHLSLIPTQVADARKLQKILKTFGFGMDLSAMGAGKTYATTWQYLNGGFTYCVVVCPAAVVSKWASVLSAHGVVGPVVLSFDELRGCARSGIRRHGLLLRPPTAAIPQEEASRSRGPLGAAAAVFHPTTAFKAMAAAGCLLVCDEAQHLKNDSTQAKAFSTLVATCHAAGRRADGSCPSSVLMLSATPFEKEDHVVNLLRVMVLGGEPVMLRVAQPAEEAATTATVPCLGPMASPRFRATVGDVGGSGAQSPVVGRARRCAGCCGLVGGPCINCCGSEQSAACTSGLPAGFGAQLCAGPTTPSGDPASGHADELGGAVEDTQRQSGPGDVPSPTRLVWREAPGCAMLYSLASRLNPAKALGIRAAANRTTAQGLARYIFRLYKEVLQHHVAVAMPVPRGAAVLHCVHAYFALTAKENAELTSALTPLRDMADRAEADGTLPLLTAVECHAAKVEAAKVSLFARVVHRAIVCHPTQKVVVSMNYTEPLRALERALQGLCRASGEPVRVAVIDGRVTGPTRAEILQSFQALANPLAVLLANVAVVDTGLDLDDKTGGEPRVLLISPNYRVASLHQLTGRIKRADTLGVAHAIMAFGACGVNEQAVLRALVRKGSVLAATLHRQVADGALFPGEYPNLVEVDHACGPACPVCDVEPVLAKFPRLGPSSRAAKR
jgi:hypothetical protein